MTAPDQQDVADAVAAWQWIPDFARTVRRDDYVVVRHPDHWDRPLEVLGLQVEPGSDVDALLDAALADARTLDHPWVAVQAQLAASDALEDALRRRGGTVVETLDVLARDVSEDQPVPDGLEVRWETETDLSVSTDIARIGAEVFGGEVPDDDFVAGLAAGADARRADGRAVAAVVRTDGVAIGSGGATLADGVLRLWGGAVLPAYRGRGAYRALVAERMRWGAAHGARMALTRGRVETSAPILQRLGFVPYGRQHDWRIDL